MGVTIESAYLGDERGRVNVTSSLQKKASSDGTISVPVDSSLIPILQVGGEITLTNDEVRQAKEKAVEACGGPNDPACIETKKMDFQRQRLEEKELESQSTANVIKGRKLTVTINENGKRRTVEVPEGQTFEYGTPKGAAPPFKLEKSMLPNISVGDIAIQVMKVLGTIGLTFVYVFSILATWKVFQDGGFVIPKFVATAAAVLIPYSGIFITLGFFAMKAWVDRIPIPKSM